MKDGLLDHLAVAQMLSHDPFEEVRCDIGIPDALGIDGPNRALFTDAKAWRFGSLDAIRIKQEIFALEKPGKLTVDGPAATVGRAKPAGAHQDVAA